MQTLEYNEEFIIKQPALKYNEFFIIDQPALFNYYREHDGALIYFGRMYFEIDTTIQTKNYRVVGVRDNHIYPSYSQKERFRAGVAQQKNKAVELKFSFPQVQIVRKEYEFGFEIELEKAELKTLSVGNEFLVLTQNECQKGYIFAFGIQANQNSAKIFKRVENASS